MFGIKLKYLLVAVAAICLGAIVASAQGRYANARLQGIAHGLRMDMVFNLMPDGNHRGQISYASHPLHVVVEDGQVTHIGWSITPYADDPVFRFIERAALEKAMFKADALPAEWDCPDQAFFTLGSVPSVFGAEEVDFTLRNVNNAQYQAEWRGPNGNLLCQLVFPINYELISGSRMRETEENLLHRLQNTSSPTPPMIGSHPNAQCDSLKQYVTLTGPELPGSLLKNTVYLSLAQDSALIFDPQLPLESLANAMSSTTASQGIKAKVKMIKYGANGGTATFEMPLSALVGEFLSQGCTPYFALMEGDPAAGDFSAVVKMANLPMGYLHLMRVKANADSLFGAAPQVEITLAAYVNDKITLPSNILK